MHFYKRTSQAYNIPKTEIRKNPIRKTYALCRALKKISEKNEIETDYVRPIRKGETLEVLHFYIDPFRQAAIQGPNVDIRESLKNRFERPLRKKKKSIRRREYCIPPTPEETRDEFRRCYLQGRYLASRKRSVIAIDYLNTAVDKCIASTAEMKGIGSVLLTKCECLIDLGKWTSALICTDEILFMYRNIISNAELLKAYYLKAETLFNLSQPEFALVAYYRGARISPSHTEYEKFEIGIKKAKRVIKMNLKKLKIASKEQLQKVLNSRGLLISSETRLTKEKQYLEKLAYSTKVNTKDALEYLSSRERFWSTMIDL